MWKKGRRGAGGQGSPQDICKGEARGEPSQDTTWDFGGLVLFFDFLPFSFSFSLGEDGGKEIGVPHPDDRTLLRRRNVHLGAGLGGR